ncbi:MAG: FG-GAP repeat protein [Myxococcota bacterium]
MLRPLAIAVWFFLVAACGRVGFDGGGADAASDVTVVEPPGAANERPPVGSSSGVAPPEIVLDESRFTTASDFVTFEGRCEPGLELFVNGVGVGPCTDGVFSYTTPQATTDETRRFVFSQERSTGERAEVVGIWTRVSALPVLALDNGALETASDQAVFRGDCTSSAGLVGVSGSDGTDIQIPCTSGRFIFTTPAASMDGTRTYQFSQTNAGGQSAEVEGFWVRNSSVPLLELDETFFVTSQNRVVFTGSCESSIGPVSIDDVGQVASAVCMADRFTYMTRSRTTDGIFLLDFSQTNIAGTTTVTTQWHRVSTSQALPNSGVQGDSGFGDAVAGDERLVVVGAPLDDTGATDRGAVYVYRYGDFGWDTPDILEPPETAVGLKFGEDLSMNQEFLAIAADCSIGSVGRVGCMPFVAIYRRVASGFEFFQAIDGPEESLFGNRVELGNTRLAVSSAREGDGAVYVYVYDQSPGLFVLEERIPRPPGPGDRFGLRFGFTDDFLGARAVGGGLFFFERVGSQWLLGDEVTVAIFGDVRVEGTLLAYSGGGGVRFLRWDGSALAVLPGIDGPADEFGSGFDFVSPTELGLVSPLEGSGGRVSIWQETSGAWAEQEGFDGLPSTATGSSDVFVNETMVVASDETTGEVEVFWR